MWWPSSVSTSGQRLRRLPNVETELGDRTAIAGGYVTGKHRRLPRIRIVWYLYPGISGKLSIPRGQCFFDVGPASQMMSQHYNSIELIVLWLQGLWRIYAMRPWLTQVRGWLKIFPKKKMESSWGKVHHLILVVVRLSQMRSWQVNKLLWVDIAKNTC